jgi:hypothetical protein
VLNQPSEADAENDLAARFLEEHVAKPDELFPTATDAWSYALRLAEVAADVQEWCRGFPELEVVGEFRLPPPGVVQRDFQALHIDFGLPTVATGTPIARFTALYREPDQAGSGVATRLVPLRRLQRARAWQPVGPVLDRVALAWPSTSVEGILARIIEAIDQSADLPEQDDAFLCGMEFNSLDEERAYFIQHQIPIDTLETEVVLQPGELLVFDNLAVAHGRRGTRGPGELTQLCVGHRNLHRSCRQILNRRTASYFAESATPVSS